ncbi:MAG: hypothetical protein KDA68_19650, partial [Planctomycetaceae bacterium]|nr:hypothetical protein [Planctomycetaceae bacterium]
SMNMTPAMYFSCGIALLADRRRRALLVGFFEAGQFGVSAGIEQGRVHRPISRGPLRIAR